MMSGVGSRDTGLDSLFASKPVGPGFEPCLGQSAKLAGAPKPLCLSVMSKRCNAMLHIDQNRAVGQKFWWGAKLCHSCRHMQPFLAM